MLDINILYEENAINALKKEIFPDNISTFLPDLEISPSKTYVRTKQRKIIVQEFQGKENLGETTDSLSVLKSPSS